MSDNVIIQVTDTVSPVTINVVEAAYAKGEAVADATGLGDVVTQLNALLVELRTIGVIKT